MKELSEKTLRYLHSIRLLNPKLYEKMKAKIGIMDDEHVSSKVFDIPEDKRKVYTGKSQAAKFDDKWKNVCYIGGKPYLSDGSVSSKPKRESAGNTERSTGKPNKTPKKPKKAGSLYIDAENISAKHAGEIIEEAEGIGNVSKKQYYNRQNDKATSPWREAGKAYELKPISMYGGPEKDKIDKKIKKDIRKSISEGTAADVIYIAASDAGYVDIIKEIKRSGRQAVVIGESKAPDKLRKAADRFIDITKK